MKPKDIIELADETNLGCVSSEGKLHSMHLFNEDMTDALLSFAALHRQALIDSGELVEKSAIAELIEAADSYANSTPCSDPDCCDVAIEHEAKRRATLSALAKIKE